LTLVKELTVSTSLIGLQSLERGLGDLLDVLRPTIKAELLPLGTKLESKLGGARARARGLVPTVPGVFLYYPRQRQLPAALAALIETLRL
jgi:hypothetical protein